LQCFEQAVALDSNYALAWSGLANALNMLGFYGLLPPESCLERSREAAATAVELDPLLAEAHTALALCYLLNWNLRESETEFLRALELNPHDLQARDWYGVFYLHWIAGRSEAAICQLRLAAKSDPLSGYGKAMLAVFYADTGRLDEALQEIESAVEVDPESFLIRWFLQLILYYQGRFEESVAAAESGLALSGRHPYCVGTLALTYADWGKMEDAKALCMELEWRARREHVSPLILGWMFSSIGEAETAIQYAQQAFQRRDPLLIATKRHLQFARFRKDSRFQEILAKMQFV